MTEFYHAHKVLLEKCRGHMICMRCCPTQAIRIKDGKAVISNELCVDCGTCISSCPSNAIIPITDPLSEISNFKYKVVVPSSVLYSQFEPNVHPYVIHLILKKLGFDEVVDVGIFYSMLARALVKYLQENKTRRPLISSECPSILRLIQVRYPDLVELVLPLDVPREIAAREIKRRLSVKLGLKPEEIGITYVAPCPAKTVSIKQPAEKAHSWLDVAVSIKDAYSVIRPHISGIMENFDLSQVPEDFVFSGDWAILGGVTHGVEMENWLSVSGLDHVKKIFDDIENSHLRNVDFVEALTCMLGCFSGPYNIENPYIARANSIRRRAKYKSSLELDEKNITRQLENGYFNLEHPVLPRPSKYFDTDLETSIKRMKERERIYQRLRQSDCGCCGAPTCMAFAEDCVRGEAKLTDCIFLAQAGGGQD
ncbi:MAG: ferredoxin [candidate division Zixibacteria bacterium HGW-Zixibacteria-1]|nr:MAG: ferredoxin [candidate division Zixibacteria bacterium HGW-Zixibacteria-1]